MPIKQGHYFTVFQWEFFEKIQKLYDTLLTSRFKAFIGFYQPNLS